MSETCSTFRTSPRSTSTVAPEVCAIGQWRRSVDAEERPIRQDDRSLVRDRDGVLRVRSTGAVGAPQRPSIGVGDEFIGRREEPGLERENQTGPQWEASAGAAVVGDVGVSVHRASDAVSTEVGVDQYPSPCATAATAAEMSPMRLPTEAESIAAARARSVVSMSRRSSSRADPTTKDTAESATQPSTATAKSRVTRSPSRRV